VLEKFVTPFIGKCGYCETYSKLHFADGNRGSFPAKDDELGCGKCGSVYRVIDVLMETDAYKQ
jgi:ribosomal protein S27AE